MSTPNYPRLGSIDLTRLPVMEVLSDVQPFTRRDTMTHMLKLEELIEWVRQVSTTLDENDRKLYAAWIEQAEFLVSEFTRVKDELIEAVVNNSIELQDPVFAALVSDVDSQTFDALSFIWSSIIIPNPEREGTFIVNTPVPVVPGELVPDPDDDGFFIPGGGA